MFLLLLVLKILWARTLQGPLLMVGNYCRNSYNCYSIHFYAAVIIFAALSLNLQPFRSEVLQAYALPRPLLRKTKEKKPEE